jgi:hypothetical protein
MLIRSCNLFLEKDDDIWVLPDNFIGDFWWRSSENLSPDMFLMLLVSFETKNKSVLDLPLLFHLFKFSSISLLLFSTSLLCDRTGTPSFWWARAGIAGKSDSMMKIQLNLWESRRTSLDFALNLVLEKLGFVTVSSCSWFDFEFLLFCDGLLWINVFWWWIYEDLVWIEFG